MTDREAFLRAIRAHPDDDTPRLIFADWLDEHGDPAQAEFIRLQVELEPIREQLDQPRVRELAEREAILLAIHGHDWLGPAADLVGPYPAFGPVFRRGLPEMVCLSLGTFLSRAEELFAACPTMREVCVYGVSGRGAELAVCPQLGQIETLEIADPVYSTAPEGSAVLCEALHSTRVARLRLPGLCDEVRYYSQLAGMLGRWAERNRPRRIEFVMLHPNPLDPDSYVDVLNRTAGWPVAQVVCPFENPFPLAGEVGQGFWAGEVKGRKTLVCLDPSGQFEYVLFDKSGRLERTFTERKSIRFSDAANPFVGYGFQPQLIHVRGESEMWEMRSGRSIRLWPRAYIRDYFESPSYRPPGVSDHWWESRGGVLKRWLHEGRFVIEWDGREYTADATGKIIAG